MSNKNTRKNNHRAAYPSQQRYQKTPSRRRLIASIIAIVIALAVFVAYVIEVGMFINLGGPEESPDGGAQRHARPAMHAAATDEADEAEADSTDEEPDYTDYSDTENAAAAEELAGSDPQMAAGHLNAVEDTDLYEDTLREILTDNYTNAEEPEDITAFTDRLDDRGTPITCRYERAEEERQQTQEDLGFVKSEILITAEGLTTAELTARIPAYLGEATETFDAGKASIVLVELSPEWTVEDAIAACEQEGLSAAPNYVYKVEDTTAAPAAATNDPESLLPDSTKQFQTDAEAAWDLLNTSGSPVLVGVLDTGVDSDHKDLDEVVSANSGTFNGNDVESGIIEDRESGEFKRPIGHGTHVCGIIAAESNNGTGISGIAAGYRQDGDTYKANDITRLVVVAEETMTSTGLMRGIDYLLLQGCPLINLSIGGKNPDDAFQYMVDKAEAQGCLLIVAAGNEHSTKPIYPAWHPSTISVVNAASASSRSSDSSYGNHCDIAAPGNSINSTIVPEKNNNAYYGKMSGTSMSTPMITGIAAMMIYQDRSLNPEERWLKPRQIKNILYATAGNKDFQGETGNQLGFGYANPLEALRTVNARAAHIVNGETVLPEQLQLNITKIRGVSGDQATLEYRVKPADATGSLEITWKSSDPKVATVTDDGLVDLKADGFCTITGTLQDDPSLQATVDVGVNCSLKNAVVSNIPDQIYTGSAIKPTGFTVTVAGRQLKEGTDYSVAYENNINRSDGDDKAKVIITGLGDFAGTETSTTFSILPKSITPAVTLSYTSTTYNGNVRCPTVTVKYGEKVLTKGTDYTITKPAGHKNAGTYTLSINLIGNYKGTKDVSFKILPKSITPKVTLSSSTLSYNGKVRCPTVTVKSGTKKLTKGTDYTLTKSAGRKKVGTYTITVNLKGNYKGSKKVTFKILPKGTAFKSVEAGKKSLTVKWNRQSTKMSVSRITGYQIQYSTSSTFAKNNHIVTVKGYKTVSRTIKNLKGGKKYYVRVRTYKDINGTRYRSKWSAAKSIKTQK